MKENYLLILQRLSSLKITVACLALFFILTLWGTIAQVESGLYAAQEKFFYSLFFPVFGFIPFPGARLVLWVLFVNLVCATLDHFRYRWRHTGVIVIHLGLLLFFVAGFITFHWSEESQLTLREGASSNVASAYHDWELSVWQQEGRGKNVIAFDANGFKPGQTLNVDEYGFSLLVKLYHPNAGAYTSTGGFPNNPTVNSSGITVLKPKPSFKEPEKNMPGAIFFLNHKGLKEINILLYGGEQNPTSLEIGGQTYYFQLRRKRFVLPFVLKLKDFEMEQHPNTEIARSYQSQVEIETEGASRSVLISMNKPLRYKNFTLYQASYAIDAMGRELSTLAVMRNSGRLLPYIASFTVVGGMVIHFLMMAFVPRKKKVVTSHKSPVTSMVNNQSNL